MTIKTRERLLSDSRLGTFAQDHDAVVLTGGQFVVGYSHTTLEGRLRITAPGETIEDDMGVDLPRDFGARAYKVAALSDGGFLRAHQEQLTDGSDGFVMQRFAADGTARGAEAEVPLGASVGIAEMIQLAGGGFALTTVLETGAREDRHHDLVILDAGLAITAEVRLTPELPDGFVGFDLTTSNPTVVQLTGGTLAVAYGAKTAERGPTREVYVQRFQPDGTALAPATLLEAFPNGSSPGTIRAVALPDGGFGVFWMTSVPELRAVNAPARVFYQRYESDGMAQGMPVRLATTLDPADELALDISTGFTPYDVEVLDNGQIFVAYTVQDPDGGPNERDIAYAAYGLDGALIQPLTIATEDVSDDQINPQLTRIDDDELLLTYQDDQNVRFAQQSGIDGVVLTTAAAPPQRLEGGDGPDTLTGGAGTDTLIGGAGDDLLTGGTTVLDLRDLIFGGLGDDTILGGHGNDELRGDAGNDNIAGGFGADTVIGGTGNDTLTGSAFGDLISGGDGFDFINGGFGSDRVNGGADADTFFHLGIADHGNDWIQDYVEAAGDVLAYGGTALLDQFQVNIAVTAGAGDANVAEAFVIYKPTGQILWALVDGAGQAEISLRIDGVTYDLMV